MTRASPLGFPMLCALAYAGGVVAYLPLLSLLVPMQVARVAGDQRFAVLAAISMAGAVAAGAANVLFGWLSDRSREHGGGRRRWMAAGLAGTLASFALIATATTPLAIGAAIVVFQVALNCLLGPMMALFAEEIPARQIGLTTGMFAAGPPIASSLSLALTAPFLPDETARLVAIGIAVALCLTPLLLFPAIESKEPTAIDAATIPHHDLAVAWVARLLVQIAGTVVFADLLYLIADPGADDGAVIGRIGTLIAVAHLAPLPLAMAAGRWSDHAARRKPVLVALAALGAIGLVAMAVASGPVARAVAFLTFSVGWGSFLPLQVGQIMRLLPDPARRGRDLGIVNLTNTVPVLVGQGLAWTLATPRHTGPLLLTLAALTAAGGLATLAVRRGR